MSLKVVSVEVFVTNLALDHNFRAVTLDVFEKLGSCQVLEIFMITDIASKLGTFVDCVL